MTQPINPLLIPELIEKCIVHVGSEPQHLKACALVSSLALGARSAAFYLQEDNYNSTANPGDHPYRGLENIFRTSPHLVPYIRQVRLLFRDDRSVEWLSKIGSLPFTHLKHVHVLTLTLTIPAAKVFRKLFSLITLCCVELEYIFSGSAFFQLLWESCSPSIPHLRLGCTHTGPIHPTSHQSSSPIPLKSLRLMEPSSTDDRLSHDICPFDFSKLSVLSIAGHTSVVGWRLLANTRPETETSQASSVPINLSLLSNLSVLYIRIPQPGIADSMALDTLDNHVLLSHPLDNPQLSIPTGVTQAQYLYFRAGGSPSKPTTGRGA
ncbi:hypothetical protein DFH08DRAFT_1010974 [Mycena albidolilacea]|uniref:Uncharacterized protein n=1 Tax=Mycena albidolilacea TaxID=1033008 RepID=A0AAD6ZW18_9AGAR|nr:hypothetical protein DFH08DRAFT_1010974 [Mycena albidolilacea]